MFVRRCCGCQVLANFEGLIVLSDHTAMILRAHTVCFGNERGAYCSANVYLYTHVHMYVHDHTYTDMFLFLFFVVGNSASDAHLNHLSLTSTQESEDVTIIEHACLCNFNSFKRRLCHILLSKSDFVHTTVKSR